MQQTKIEDPHMLPSCRKIYLVEKSTNEKLKICERDMIILLVTLDIYRCMKKQYLYTRKIQTGPIPKTKFTE